MDEHMFEDIITNKTRHFISDEKANHLIDLIMQVWCVNDEDQPECIHFYDEDRFEKYCRKCWKDYITS
jgi:hypothetical protein